MKSAKLQGGREEGRGENKQGSTGNRARDREGKVENKQLTMHKLGRVRIGEMCGEIN